MASASTQNPSNRLSRVSGVPSYQLVKRLVLIEELFSDALVVLWGDLGPVSSNRISKLDFPTFFHQPIPLGKSERNVDLDLAGAPFLVSRRRPRARTGRQGRFLEFSLRSSR